MKVIQQLVSQSEAGRKLLAVLLDPDKVSAAQLPLTLEICHEAGVSIILVGGSLLLHTGLDEFVGYVKARTRLPVVLFPGEQQQVSSRADAILLLSLISGRNADLLIGRHVSAAPRLRASGLEIIPTGYLLIGSENHTSASYVTQTQPIPGDKDDIAGCTALAGEMLGLRLIYLDAGSGAVQSVSPSMVRKVKELLSVPLVVGGGVRDAATASAILQAGADMLVLGNAAEKDPDLILRIAEVVSSLNVMTHS